MMKCLGLYSGRMEYRVTVLLRNRLISAGLKPILSLAENHLFTYSIVVYGLLIMLAPKLQD